MLIILFPPSGTRKSAEAIQAFSLLLLWIAAVCHIADLAMTGEQSVIGLVA